jgi:large-conductance mechanosensitive channel
MIVIGKAFAAIALGLSALVLTPIVSHAQGTSVIEQCQEQVKQIWPQTNLEYQRTEHDLVRACVQNGGRIPG